MPYKYLDDVVSDVGIKAWGEDLQELFLSACNALTGVMLPEMKLIPGDKKQTIEVQSETLEMLLFEALQEIVFLKDARGILLFLHQCAVENRNERFFFTAEVFYGAVESLREHLEVDVKAVTMYNFSLTEKKGRWEARVVVDV